MQIIIKPEYKELDSYIKKDINNFLLPLEDYSVEYTTYFTLFEIKEIKDKYPNINLFISINKNIMNSEINSLEKILKELNSIGIKALFYYDFAIIALFKKLNLNYDLVWNQTHMVTNYRTCNYYNNLGVKYALISKEITKDEIIEIINNSTIKPIVELISKPVVAFSKRHLITNYYKDLNKNKENNIVINENVSNSTYYVQEMKDGTTFIKNDILNGTSILEDLLLNNLEYILLKEDLIDHELFLEVIDKIVYFINNYKNLTSNQKSNWQNSIDNLLGEDTGFFFKKTIYKVK